MVVDGRRRGRGTGEQRGDALRRDAPLLRREEEPPAGDVEARVLEMQQRHRAEMRDRAADVIGELMVVGRGEILALKREIRSDDGRTFLVEPARDFVAPCARVDRVSGNALLLVE